YTLSSSYARLEMCAEARKYAEESLQISLRVYGEDHPNLFLDYQMLAQAHVVCEDADPAIAAYLKAIAIVQKAEPDSLRVATAEFSAGLGMVALERPRDALPHLDRSLAIREQKGSQGIGVNYNALGDAHYGLNEYAESKTMYQKALDFFEKHS